ncbi:hypothetical protein [Amycolatopsis pigmentata]|uniref:PPE family protein n=1 Tax=Amycolatopsis pigmentata TaxID=450801 RepID=A0ABW5G0G8_9PSEU
MPDNNDSTLKLPDGRDYSRLTFEQVLVALTGLGNDLRAPLSPTDSNKDAGSFLAHIESDKDWPTATFGNYSAFQKFFYGANINTPAFTTWTKALDEIDALIPQLAQGKLGAMDTSQVWEVKALVDQYTSWLDQNEKTLQSWINALDSQDAAFRGRAAFAIQQNLERIRHVMHDVHGQITQRTPADTSAMLALIAEWLYYVASSLAQLWYDHRNDLYNAVTDATQYISDSIHRYIWGMGLIAGTPQYVLNHYIGNQAGGEDYINKTLAGFDSTINGHEGGAWVDHLETDQFTGATHVGKVLGPGGYFNFDDMGKAPTPPPGFPPIKGDLRSKATWDDFNAKIRDFAIMRLKSLDTKARDLLNQLEAVYEQARGPLAKVDDIKPPTLGSPPPSGGGSAGGNPPPLLPPPGGSGGDYHAPPGGDGGDFGPPPDGSDHYNPFNPQGGDGGDFGPPPNGSDSYNPFNPQGGDGSGNDNPANAPGGPGNNFLAVPPGGSDAGPLPYPPGGFTPSLSPNGTLGTNNKYSGYEPPPTGENLFVPPPGGKSGGNTTPEGWVPPPPGAAPELPSLTHNGLSIPPGGAAGAPGPGGAAGGAGGFAGGAAGGFGGAPGAGGAAGGFGGAPGAGEAATSGGALGGSGEGWADWSGDLGSGGGHEGLTSGLNQAGGASVMPPMIPPMMGGMGGMGAMGGMGGAAKERERERQTWLSEDEKVWGIENAVGNGVIGRPDGEPVTDEPLAPQHVHVRAASRRKAPEKRAEATATKEGTGATEVAEATGGTASAEASGSA